MNDHRTLREKAAKVFNQSRQPEQPEADAAIFGPLSKPAARVDLGRVTAKMVDIFSIWPNPTQPRRAMPSAVRLRWNGDPASLPALLDTWRQLAEYEIGEAVDAQAIVYASAPDPAVEIEVVADEDETPFPVSASLIKLAELAASIYRDGLTNPITAENQGEWYLLETGERRWLAHHLLYHITQDEKWRNIPVRVVARVDLWRQATENNARSGLTAIGRARQLALLLMDLLRAEGYEFYDFDAFESEQDFYAQVADGQAYRIPRGKSKLLLGAMGLQNAVQLRQYRALLRLPAEIWMQADDRNWTERACRRWVDEDTVTVVTVSDEDSPTLPGGAGGEAEKAFDISNALPAGTARPAKLMPKEVQQGVRYLTSLKDVPGEQREREALRARIQATRAWLDDLERRLR